MKSIIRRIPAFARSSDPAQRKAGGNIIKFLAALLALTLIARGTSGATLAKVELVSPSRSEIVDLVSGSAIVSARDSIDIKLPEGLTVVEMPVGAGQTVRVGDVVATLNTDEVNAKLIRAKASLEKMLFDMEKLLRTDTVDTSLVENARRSLRRAQEDYSGVKAQGEADIRAAKTTLDEVLLKQADEPDQTAMDTAIRNLERARDDYDTGKAWDEADVAAAQASLDESLKKRAQAIDSSQVDSAWRSLNRAQQDYNAAKVKSDTEVITAQAALDEAISLGEPAGAIEILEAALRAAKERRDENLQSASRRVEDAQAAYSKAEQDYYNSSQQTQNALQTEIDNMRSALNAARKKAEDNKLNADRRVEDAGIALAQAQQNYEKSVQQVLAALSTETDNARNALNSAQKKAEDNLLSAARRVEDAETSLASAERDLSRNTQQAEDSTAQNNASTTTLLLDIEEQKTVVDALNLIASNEGLIYSDITGTISFSAEEGSVTGRDPLISFMDGAKGYEARTQLSRTDAEKLSVGDECQVTTGGGSLYYTPTVTGSISSISQPNDQDKVQVTILLPEADWSEGQRVEVQVVFDRSTYDMCIPLSALRSDNSGYYVFLIEQRSTVLGTENVVTRVPVTVTASDGEMASIRGPVSRSSQIVSGSNKAISIGGRVRMAE